MSHGVLFSVQLCTTYATNFIIKTQVEALYTHMRVSQKFFSIAVQTCPFDVQCATVTVEECFQTNTPSEP